MHVCNEHVNNRAYMIADMSIDMCIEIGLDIGIRNGLAIGIDMGMNIDKGKFRRTCRRMFTDIGTITNL